MNNALIGNLAMGLAVLIGIYQVTITNRAKKIKDGLISVESGEEKEIVAGKYILRSTLLIPVEIILVITYYVLT